MADQTHLTALTRGGTHASGRGDDVEEEVVEAPAAAPSCLLQSLSVPPRRSDPEKKPSRATVEAVKAAGTAATAKAGRATSNSIHQLDGGAQSDPSA